MGQTVTVMQDPNVSSATAQNATVNCSLCLPGVDDPARHCCAAGGDPDGNGCCPANPTTGQVVCTN